MNRPEAKASVLVVEGWIGFEGIEAAFREFQSGRYEWILPVGGLTSGRWTLDQSNYAEMAGLEFLRLGVPGEKLIVAKGGKSDVHRTFQSAIDAKAALMERGLTPEGIDIFTQDIHTRRSRLVFTKVLGPETRVGCISWLPNGEKGRPFWQSSERSENLIDETVAYFFELFVNSGRGGSSVEG